MTAMALVGLAARQLLRHPARSLLTILGVGTGIFMFTVIGSLQEGVARATGGAREELVVYRAQRFCPFTSRLPERYRPVIAGVEGVAAVVPVRVVVNNCNTSLDVVVLHGIPAADLESVLARRGMRLISGSLDAWRERSDAVLVGETLAHRRRLTPGTRFTAAGVASQVAGILAGDDAQAANLGLAHIDYLQRHSAGGLGTVTQFEVMVRPGFDSRAVAAAIDRALADETEPTGTQARQEFLARSAHDLVALIGWTRLIAWAALVAIAALILNTVSLAMRGRQREHAVLGTLGYPGTTILCLVVVESGLLSLCGGLVGIAAGAALLHWGSFALTSEGLSIVFSPSLALAGQGLGIAAAIGVIGGLIPAWLAAQRPIVLGLRVET